MQGFDPTVPQVGDIMDPDPIRLNFCAAFSHESGPTPPVTWSQMVGCCWFDTGANRMWIFSGTEWKPITWNTPHSTLSDLDKDDHPHYFTLDGTKTVQQMMVAPGGRVDTLDISNLTENKAGMHNLLINGSFEYVAGDVVPGWLKVGAPAIAQVDGVFEGKAVYLVPSTSNEGLEQTRKIRSFTDHKVSGYVRVDTGNEAKVKVAHGSYITTCIFTNPTWQRFSVPFTSTDSELPCTVSLIVVSSLGGAGFDEVALHEGGVSPAYQHNIVLDRELRGSVWYAEDVKKQYPGFRVEAGRKAVSFWNESEKTTYLPFESANDDGLVLCQVRTATGYWFVWKVHSVSTTMAIVKVKCLDGAVKAGLTLDYLGVFYE